MTNRAWDAGVSCTPCHSSERRLYLASVRIPRMNRTQVLVTAQCSLLFAVMSVALAEVPNAPSGLLPTQALARQARELQSAPISEEDNQRRVIQAKVLRHRISNFIVQQLEALPSISGSQLQAQLQEILCSPDISPCEGSYSSPKVFAVDPWGPKAQQRQVIVAYEISLGFMGPNGTLVTIESYVWHKDSQKAERTSHGGSEFDGRRVKFELLTWYPNEYWIFASGPPLGWSGRAYAGQATLYCVGIDSVSTVWKSGILPNLTVQRNELGWEANYADRDRFYGNLPAPWVFDVYKFNYDTRHYQRVIHYRYESGYQPK